MEKTLDQDPPNVETYKRIKANFVTIAKRLDIDVDMSLKYTASVLTSLILSRIDVMNIKLAAAEKKAKLYDRERKEKANLCMFSREEMRGY